jgi:general secretion pathway protein M
VIGALRLWWQGLARRERWLVAAGCALALGGVVYVAAVEPAWKARARLASELPRLRAQALEMSALSGEARELRGRGAAAESAGAAQSAMERSLAAAGLGMARIVALDERRIAVSVKGAQATKWLGWLEETARESRMRVAVVQVARTAARGIVDAEATFELARP